MRGMSNERFCVSTSFKIKQKNKRSNSKMERNKARKKLSSSRKVIKLKIVTNLFNWSLKLFSNMKGAFY